MKDKIIEDLIIEMALDILKNGYPIPKEDKLLEPYYWTMAPLQETTKIKQKVLTK